MKFSSIRPLTKSADEYTFSASALPSAGIGNSGQTDQGLELKSTGPPRSELLVPAPGSTLALNWPINAHCQWNLL